MGKMLGDYFTKPLKGSIFRKFRAEIQGIPEKLQGGWVYSVENPVNQSSPYHRIMLDIMANIQARAHTVMLVTGGLFAVTVVTGGVQTCPVTVGVFQGCSLVTSGIEGIVIRTFIMIIV